MGQVGTFANRDQTSNRSSRAIVGLFWAVPFVVFLYFVSAVLLHFDQIHVLNLAKIVCIALAFSIACQYFYRLVPVFGAALVASLTMIAVFAYLEGFVWLYWIGIVIMALQLIRGIQWSAVRSVLPYVLAVGLVQALLLIPYFSLIYSEPFNASRLINGGMHNDTLYHAAIAAMIKTQHVVSHGLHGVGPLEYHFGSHILIAAASVLTKISVWESYSYFFVFVCAPLVGIAILGVAEEWLPSNRKYDFFVKASVFAILILGSGILVRDSMLARYAVWPSFYESESYTVSLIAFMAVVSILNKFGPPQFDRWLSLLLLIGIAAVTSAKISTGAFSLILGGIWVLHSMLCDAKQVWIKRLALGLACLILFLVLAPHISPVGSAGSFDPLQFVRTYVEGAIPLWLKATLFVPIHFMFSVLALLFVGLLYFTSRTWPGWLPKWYVYGAIPCFFIGLASVLLMRIQGGSGVYFSNPSMFLAMPVLVAVVPAFIEIINHPTIVSHISTKILYVFGASMAAVGLWGMIEYGGVALSNGIEDYTNGMRRPVLGGTLSPYVDQLLAIRNDPKTKGAVVFIPRTETAYWAKLHCNASGYLIPAVSERPSLYSWPAPDCYQWLCSPRFHSDGLCEESQKPHSDEQLKAEAKRLGFDNVYIVTAGNTRILE